MTFSRLFPRFNAWLVRATGGRLGGQMGGQSILLLTTTGRRTGQPHTTPMSFYRDGTRYVVVASNWGRDTQPDWLLNLRRQPRAAIQVGGRQWPVTASEAQDDEYARLWALVTPLNGQFLAYQRQTTRQIPVVVLTPLSGAAETA